MKNIIRKSYLLASVAALALPMTAHAQDDGDANDDEISVQDVIVVTGTSAQRTGFDTPQQVSQYDEDELRTFTASSQADVLTQLPGVIAEGGGGEIATNFFVRGLPSGGAFQFTPLEYDGIPTLSTFGLNSSAFDVYQRNDLGIERLEYVTGGVSNLFGPGSVAGIVNYVSKTGGPESEGTLQAEWAEEGRFRGDFAASGPMGGADTNTFYALSGYYRYDEGPLESGLATEGFQVRGNLKREFTDGSGSFTVYGQLIDDHVQFFLPLPLDGSSRERVAGNDGSTVYTVNTAQAGQLSYATPDGRFESPIDEGVTTAGGSLAFVLDKDLGDGWGINAKAKYAKYAHDFNLFLDGDGNINVPESQAEFLANRDYGLPADATFTFADSGAAFPADFLLFGNRTLDRVRDVDDFSAEFNLTKSFDAGAVQHNVTLGSFVSNTSADDLNYITTFLAELNNAPRLVDVSVTDLDGSLTGTVGSQFAVTQNGLLNANGQTGNRERSAFRYAFYLADQMELDRWVFDVGVRIETFEGEILQRNLAQTVVSSDPLVNDDLETVGFPTGSAFLDDVSETEWAASANVLYKLSDDVNLFANFSRGYFFPALNGQGFNSLGELGPYESEIILTSEVGAKLNKGNFSGYVTGFFTELSDRQSVTFVNDGMGGVVNIVEKTSTEAFGIETGGTYQLTDNLSINGNLSWRSIEVTESEDNPALVGNELIRQPALVANTGVTYDDGRFDFSVFHNYHGENFANSANTVELDSYNLVRLEAGYTVPFANEDKLRIGVSVFNLFDSEGVTEGSPRQGNLQVGGGDFFVGRPILPRRVFVRATYDF